LVTYIVKRHRHFDRSIVGCDAVRWIAPHAQRPSNFGQDKPKHSGKEVQQKGYDSYYYAKNRGSVEQDKKEIRF
jgi:hypothetical protein